MICYAKARISRRRPLRLTIALSAGALLLGLALPAASHLSGGRSRDMQPITFKQRGAAWPKGRQCLIPVSLPEPAGAPARALVPRPWFETSHITVEGIPFEVPRRPSQVAATTAEGEETIEVALPPRTTEVLLLLCADFPSEEPLGVDGACIAALDELSEPERMVIELTYADGVRDEMIPVCASTRRYGVIRGAHVYSVKASAGHRPATLCLRDRMRNAAFAILGATANVGAPKVPEPETHPVWYPPREKPKLAPADFSFATERGLTWRSVVSPMLGDPVALRGRPVFTLRLGEAEIPSSRWAVEKVEQTGGTFRVRLSYQRAGVSLLARFQATRTKPNEVLLSLDVENTGDAAVTGQLFFPQVTRLKIGRIADTWYFASRYGGVINRTHCSWRDPLGEQHPLQVDGFFNPYLGAGIAFMPRDLTEVFRYYNLAKDRTGCSWSLEFLPRTVPPGERWESVPVAVTVVPGDWKDQFNTYLEWVRTWYKPISPRKQWFREVFSFFCDYPGGRTDYLERAREVKASLGACDYVHLFGWAMSREYGHWGEYDHFHQYDKNDADGKSNFIGGVRRLQQGGYPLGLYLDGYLVSDQAVKPSHEQREEWGVRGVDGKLGIYYGDALSMCPYADGWRDYLASVYQRVAREIKPDGMYIDEFGRSLENRICWAPSHGHPVPMGTSPGEGILMRQIREAIPGKIALYSEFVPSDVSCQYEDGAFYYGVLSGYLGSPDFWISQVHPETSSEQVAPHYLNIARFAFPDFKVFHIVYSMPHVNGNWSLIKFPFFNGDAYYHKTGTPFNSDDHAKAFYRRVFAVQHAHRDAFTSGNVGPLVRTEAPDLFANRFSARGKTVWTLYNANRRTLRGLLLTVEHHPGATYTDAWAGAPVTADVKGSRAALTFEIGPRSVGCIVQQWDHDAR